jgi:hypothetical protein
MPARPVTISPRRGRRRAWLPFALGGTVVAALVVVLWVLALRDGKPATDEPAVVAGAQARAEPSEGQPPEKGPKKTGWAKRPAAGGRRDEPPKTGGRKRLVAGSVPKGAAKAGPAEKGQEPAGAETGSEGETSTPAEATEPKRREPKGGVVPPESSEWTGTRPRAEGTETRPRTERTETRRPEHRWPPPRRGGRPRPGQRPPDPPGRPGMQPPTPTKTPLRYGSQFDGRGLDGWAPRGGTWQVIDGAIVGSGKEGSGGQYVLLLNKVMPERYELTYEFAAGKGLSGDLYIDGWVVRFGGLGAGKLSVMPCHRWSHVAPSMAKQNLSKERVLKREPLPTRRAWRKAQVLVQDTRVEIAVDGEKLVAFTATGGDHKGLGFFYMTGQTAKVRKVRVSRPE